ncbi:MAG: LPS export ABC transporter periplasmic protein LptC, partial [Duncaniella sp.]|nr:LPS export ABC transporter periplasmic protein LptC [Duncaniella sp.]
MAVSRLRLLPVAVTVAVASLVAVSCKDDSQMGVADVDAAVFPTMVTRDVETLISDSGITRFRITTPVWYVYDEVDEPYWRFPDGLYLEKFDDIFRKEATIRSDSATYFKNKQLWRLDGNVDISNVANERFLTQQLYWDQRAHKVYSDSFIHIERADRVIEGYGFESNEQMSRYSISNVAGIFPAAAFTGGDRATRGDDADTVAV